MIWLLIGYMWLFIYRPFEVWPWLGALHIERVYMLATISYWAVFATKTWNPGRVGWPTLVLAVTYLVASQTSPYATFHTVEDWFKILVFFLLLATTIRNERDFMIIVVAFVCITALYELLSLREYVLGRHKWEMGTKRMRGIGTTLSHPNSFGATVNYSLPWLYPVWTLAAKRWQKVSVIAAGVLAITCVLLTGSRSSFVGLIVIVVTVALISKYRWRILPIVLIVPVIWGLLRPDLQDRYISLVDPSKGVGAAQATAEGRTKSFFYGVNSFLENPLTGAGLESYRSKTNLATHSLYNQSMGELGIWGLAVIIGFAWAFTRDFKEARILSKGSENLDVIFLNRVCVAAFSTCLLLFFLGWAGHNLDRYHWLWCGVFSGFAVHFLRQRAETQSSDELHSQTEPT